MIPHFCKSQFTGNNATVTTYNGTSLYFRGESEQNSYYYAQKLTSVALGRLILDAVLDDLKTLPLGNGWNNARNVRLYAWIVSLSFSYLSCDWRFGVQPRFQVS